MAGYAAIDIGTHSVRLLIHEENRSRKYVKVTRLGEGTSQTGRLSEVAMTRTVHAVQEFLEQAVHRNVLMPIWCYATSAARECVNGPELLERLNALPGLRAEIISGEMEAMIACRGAAAPGYPVLDIGGGSTELIRLQGGTIHALSVPMGTVTMLERYGLVPEDMEADAMHQMEESIRSFAETLCQAVLPRSGADTLFGVGGTATQLAMLFLALPTYDSEQVQDYVMSLEKMKLLLKRLIQMDSEQRRALPGMHPQRADVIVSGCMIACAMLQASGAKRLVASDRDGLDGYLAWKIEKQS